MKISERSYPFLRLVRERKDNFQHYPIHILTQPYVEAVNRAAGTLSGLCDDPSTYSGSQGIFALSKRFAYCYRFDEDGLCTISNIAVGDVVWTGTHVGKAGGNLALSCEIVAPWARAPKAEVEEEISNAIDICAHLVVFSRYAELETKHLKPGQREKAPECKYVNDSRVPVTIMNCTWFTTLVKSDAFKVSGHFRLQPCGEGLKDRKLIFVNDFMKSGYTAPARKIAALEK